MRRYLASSAPTQSMGTFADSSETHPIAILAVTDGGLIENHRSKIGVAFDQDRSFDDRNLFSGSFPIVRLAYGIDQGLIKLIDVERDGLIFFWAVEQRVMCEGDPGDGTAPGIPFLPKRWLLPLIPADLNTPVGPV